MMSAAYPTLKGEGTIHQAPRKDKRREPVFFEHHLWVCHDLAQEDRVGEVTVGAQQWLRPEELPLVRY